MIEFIKDRGETLAIIFNPDPFATEGIEFVTNDEDILQLGYMKYQENKQIQPHIHKPFKRETVGTSEVIFIKSGRIRANFFTNQKIPIKSLELNEGTWMILINGGHGFDILEPTEMIEVKNGPYADNLDKERF